MNLGDFDLETTLHSHFTTRSFTTGAPAALSGGSLAVYEDDNLTQITAGVTLTASFDGVSGLNHWQAAATAANGYEAGKQYSVVVTAGTVGGVSVVGEVVATFSIEKARVGAGGGGLTEQQVRDAMKLAPTGGAPAPGSVDEHLDSIDTSTGGLAGAAMRGTDGAATPGDAMDLVNNAVDANSLADNAISAAKIANNALENAKFATNAISATKIATDAITNAKIAANAITSSEAPNLDAAVSTRATPAEVKSQADQALVDIHLDHLLAVAYAAGAPPGVVGSWINALTEDAGGGTPRYTASALSQAPSGGGGGLTEQQVRDAMKLAPTAGAPDAGSVDEHLDEILADVTGLNGDPMRGTDGAAQPGDDMGLLQSAADKVWASTTRTLTAFSTGLAVSVWDVLETAIVTASSIGVKVKNNLDGTITSRQPSGPVDLNSNQAGVTVGTVNALGAQAQADVNAEVVDALAVDNYPEPTTPPSASASLASKIGWIQALARNEVRQTATQQTVRNDGNSSNIGTATASDDGTTTTRGKFV